MHVGGRPEKIGLSDRDREICAAIGPLLKEKGQIFVGIDVIGDFLTEVNVTSPTCIRELDQQYGLDIAGQLMDAIETVCRDAATVRFVFAGEGPLKGELEGQARSLEGLGVGGEASGGQCVRHGHLRGVHVAPDADSERDVRGRAATDRRSACP